MSLLDLIGLRPSVSWLTSLLVVTVLCLAGWLAYALRGKLKLTREIEVTCRFVILSMIAVYFLFFRIYEQYYLWVLPFMILYSFSSSKVTPSVVGFMLGSVVGCIVAPLGLLLTGRTYFFTRVNLPADVAIAGVLPTCIVAVILLSVVDLAEIEGSFMIFLDFLLLVSLSVWLSFELARYTYYGIFSWSDLIWAVAMIALICLTHYDGLKARALKTRRKRAL